MQKKDSPQILMFELIFGDHIKLARDFTSHFNNFHAIKIYCYKQRK